MADHASGILVVGFVLDPSSWIAADKKLADLVVDKDGKTEWYCRQPPCEADRVHPQAFV